MPRNYNTTGSYTGVSGSGRAYTPQVTPWERDDDDSSVIREDEPYSDRPSRAHASEGAAGRKGEGDVWNRELSPSPDLVDAQDRDNHRDDRASRSDRDPNRQPHRDDNRRSFARDTQADTSADQEPRYHHRETGHDNNYRTSARDTLDDTVRSDSEMLDDRAWDRDNGVRSTHPDSTARRADETRDGEDPRDASFYGRANDGLSPRQR